MEQPRFLMLVGLPASGKSTFVIELMDGRDDIVYVSSDELREKMLGDVNNQDKNGDVFENMLELTKHYLSQGIHVIYDATNISRKRRKHLLTQLPKGVHKTAVYMATPYKVVVEQNNSRERVVPQDVIDRMYKTLQIPIYTEGWDNIVFHHHDETLNGEYPKQFSDAVRAGVLFNREGYDLMGFLASYFDEFFPIYDLPQDSKWHQFSVSRHIYYVYREVLENWDENDFDKEVMLWASLLHDTGKAFCKSFYSRKGEEMRYAQFIGHEYVGSQIAVPLLKRLGFDDIFIHKVATLIQFHMYLLDANANKQKLIDRVGEDTYKKLEFLRDADTIAH
jgi:predicted kinase